MASLRFRPLPPCSSCSEQSNWRVSNQGVFISCIGSRLRAEVMCSVVKAAVRTEAKHCVRQAAKESLSRVPYRRCHGVIGCQSASATRDVGRDSARP